MTSANPPTTKIIGGCLCGAVQYELLFPQGSQWPPNPHTCQCTQCRRFTGCLIANFITVSVSQLRWSEASASQLTPDTRVPYALRKYESSPGHFRSFCGVCGGSISWNEEPNGVVSEIEILTGGIDEVSLKAAIGKQLTLPTGGNFFFKNAVDGVTDQTLGGEGKKFVEGSEPGRTLDS